MKQIATLPAPVLPHRIKVKRLLIQGIIRLTSEKFLIFAEVIGCLWELWGVCTNDNHAVAFGALVFTAALVPWGWRKASRDLRQDRLGLKKW